MYYAGETRITDRSLQALARINSIERLTFSACAGVTNAGVAALTALPNLRELTLESMPGLTRESVVSFAPHVRVVFTT